MKRTKMTGFIKTLLVLIAAVMCFGSCDVIKKETENAVNSAIDSVKGEISSAIEEGKNELSDARNELDDNLNEVTEALSQASDAYESAKDEVSEQISSVSEEVKSEISEAVSNSDTAAETTQAAKWYTFRNKTRYDEHYEKHGAEFGSITKEQYLQLANDLINSTSDRVLHKYSEDGDYMYFDQDTGHFLVLSEDGYIRTFFIPTAGINYWNRQ